MEKKEFTPITVAEIVVVESIDEDDEANASLCSVVMAERTSGVMRQILSVKTLTMTT